MLNASQMLLNTYKNETKTTKEVFSFKWLAKRIIKRQEIGKDFIIIVVGDRRNGKSNWMLKLILAYIKEKRKLNPNFKWSWKDNFALTRSEAVKKAEAVPTGSFCVYDEAADIAYRSDTLSVMNKNLIKFMNKSGKKLLLTILVLPDIYQLDPKIMNMAHFLVAVPYRYKEICAFAFIYGRNPNPFITDKFGLERIKRLFSSKKIPASIRIASMEGKMKVGEKKEKIVIPYPKQLFRFLISLPNFMYSHRFKPVNRVFEKAYIKNVKDKQLMAHEEQETYVPMKRYKKLKKRYETFLYNVYKHGDPKGGKMSYMMLVNLHRDEKGEFIANTSLISNIINNMKLKFNEMRIEYDNSG